MRDIDANDLMNPEILTVQEDLPVQELAVFLMNNEISGAPVRSRTGQLIGVVSVVDIARAASEEEDPKDADEHPFFLGGEVGGLSPADRELLEEEERELLVADIMTPTVYTVPEDATVSEIATTMVDNHLHRLLVTRGGRPVGIISTSDLLGLLIEDRE